MTASACRQGEQSEEDNEEKSLNFHLCELNFSLKLFSDEQSSLVAYLYNEKIVVYVENSIKNYSTHFRSLFALLFVSKLIKH